MTKRTTPMSIARRAAIFSGAIAAALFAQQQAPDRYPDAPYVPTPIEVVEEMLKLANVAHGDVLYDLGCGDGRIVLMAAKKFGATAVGVDIDEELLRDARKHAREANAGSTVRFIQQDLFETDTRPATVVMVYLLPKLMERLKVKLLKELKPGARVVSFSFPFPDWTPAKVSTVNGRPIYLWVIPGGSE